MWKNYLFNEKIHVQFTLYAKKFESTIIIYNKQDYSLILWVNIDDNIDNNNNDDSNDKYN